LLARERRQTDGTVEKPRERIHQRERGGSVEWVEKRRRNGMGGGKFVKREREREREKDREEEERVGW
jgi:hypothetical protein